MAARFKHDVSLSTDALTSSSRRSCTRSVTSLRHPTAPLTTPVPSVRARKLEQTHPLGIRGESSIAVRAPEPNLDVVDRLIGEHGGDGLLEQWPVLGNNGRHLRIDGGRGKHAHDRVHAIVGEGDVSGQVDLEHTHRQRVRQPAQQLLASAQLLLDADLLHRDSRHLSDHNRVVRIVQSIDRLDPRPRPVGGLIPAPPHAVRPGDVAISSHAPIALA